jgi:tetratricopeptide (TPR) repeat protein
MKKPDSGRVVLPKWRRLDYRAANVESRSVPSRSSSAGGIKPHLGSLTVEWEANRALPFATDLMSAALTTGDMDASRDAAAFALEQDDISPLAASIARRVLGTGSPTQVTEAHPDRIDGKRDVIDGIARLKRLRVQNDDNPFTWTELSRLYASIGQGEKASDAMRVALALAPRNRYVLRSAARLLVHQGAPDEAHRLLLRATRESNDPWLVASEIAVAQFGDRVPQGVSNARRLLESGLHPSQITELASALGTLELEAGKDRRARKLFNRSISDPNDNALAQAEWASRRLQLDELDQKIAAQEGSFEAHALAAAQDRRVPEAIAYAFAWLEDEPYSLRPAMFGSYQAAKGRDFESGAKFAKQGLLSHPNDPMLLNNLAFCLAKQGDVARASEYLDRIDESLLEADKESVLQATRGLIAMRSGRFEAGVENYRAAITATDEKVQKSLALIMFASELLRAESLDGTEVAREAEDAARALDTEEAEGWLDHLRVHEAE